MAKIGKTKFESMSAEEKKTVVKNKKNRLALNEVRTMCDPHSRMEDYENDIKRLIDLVDAFFTMCPKKMLNF